MRVRRDRNVCIVVMDRPARANAIDQSMFGALGDALADTTRDPNISVVVLTGAGRHFCAGADVEHGLRAPNDRSEANAPQPVVNPFDALRESEIPVIAAVEGAAVGIGFGLALAADVVVASHSARFEAPQVAFGLVPDGGLAYTLPRAVGRSMARAMILFGMHLDGPEAHRHGVAAAVADTGTALDVALDLARSATEMPRGVLQRAKRVLDAGDVDLSTTIEAERRGLSEGFRDPAYADAITRARAR